MVIFILARVVDLRKYYFVIKWMYDCSCCDNDFYYLFGVCFSCFC